MIIMDYDYYFLNGYLVIIITIIIIRAVLTERVDYYLTATYA